MSNVPDIRFKGFTDAWEQRELGEIGVISTGNTPSTQQKNYSTEGMLWITPTDIKSNITTSSVRKLSEKGIQNARRVPAGSILVTCIASIGKNTLVKEECGFNQQINALTPHPNFDSYFLLTQSIFWSEKMRNIAASGTMQIVNKKDFSKLKFLYPSINEQILLGQFYENINNTITLLQRKIDNLKKVKKDLLQKLFPLEQSINPKIRFSGFDQDWEKRVVSEITNFHKQGFYTTEKYSENGKYFLLRGTDFIENKLVLRNTPKIDASDKIFDDFKIEIGDFLIVRSGTVGTYGIIYNEIPAIFGSYLINFRFNKQLVTNEFFGYFFQSTHFTKQLSKITQQSANTNINAENIKSTKIKLPSINEQLKINKLLLGIDSEITLLQKELEMNKQVKKGFLQKLFPKE